MKTEWRPSDWEDTKDNQHKQFGMMRTAFDSMSYEAGASAMLSALLKWLWEPCSGHITRPEHIGENLRYWHHAKEAIYFKHRHDCPQCMAELKESVK
jgi:hypothetical protein